MRIDLVKLFYKALIIPFVAVIFVQYPGYTKDMPESGDSVKINLQQAESIFLKNNLQLLAARYNINASRAAVMQSELWDNPNITIGQNIYNKITGKYFDFTSNGNTDIQLQQLITLAGKRNYRVKLASINTGISESSFYDLLRTLKHELRTDLYDLYFLQQSLKFYDETIPSVIKTVDASEKIFENHAILLSEVLRLKSLLLTLESERLAIKGQISDIETDLNVLLADSIKTQSYFIPEVNVQSIDSLSIGKLTLDDALQTALENRPDIKTAESNVKYEETNLSLQKALAVPDITLGGSYSKHGGYVPDYLALTMSIDLPVFNRNQGNIEVSENTIEANKYLMKQSIRSVQKDVISAYNKAVEADKLYRNIDKSFTGQYKKLVNGMNANYASRNMTIIEFTDFYESYRSSILQALQLQNSRIDAFENLNFTVGADLLTLSATKQ